MLVCNDGFGMFCPLQGSDSLGPSGEPGAKGERGETGIPSTEPGVPGDRGFKGFIGDPGSSKCQISYSETGVLCIVCLMQLCISSKLALLWLQVIRVNLGIQVYRVLGVHKDSPI